MQDRETASGENRPDTFCWVLPRTQSGFLTPSDFEGGPKIDHFWKKYKKNEKKEVPKTALNKHDLLIDFSLNFGWILISFLMFFWYLYHSHMQPFIKNHCFSNEFHWFYCSEKQDFWWFSWSFPLTVVTFIFSGKRTPKQFEKTTNIEPQITRTLDF